MNIEKPSCPSESFSHLPKFGGDDILRIKFFMGSVDENIFMDSVDENMFMDSFDENM